MNDWDGRTERRSSKTFEVRYELLGIIGIMVIQLIGAVWWASSIATSVKYMRADITRLAAALEKASNDRYTSSDAARDHLIINERINRLENKGG